MVLTDSHRLLTFPSPCDYSTHSVSNIYLRHHIFLQLLGELYADKKYLEKLMDDQGTMTRYFTIHNIKLNYITCSKNGRQKYAFLS